VRDKDSSRTEENPDSNPNEVQRAIPFDARKSIGWAQSATEKESEASKVNPSPSWGVVVLRLHLIHRHHSHFHVLINMAVEHPSPNLIRNHVCRYELRG
jgi:hypothetical protein